MTAPAWFFVAVAWMPMQDDPAVQLVRQLGHPSYTQREAAVEELMAFGAAARPAVQEGTADEDPEIRVRCEALLPVLARLDLERRIQLFEAEPDNPKHQKLPGWKRFTQLTSSPEDRKLYIRLLRRHGVLFEQIEQQPRIAPELYLEYCQQFALKRRVVVPRVPPSEPNLTDSDDLADVIAFFFLGADPATRSGDLPYTQSSAVLRFPAFTRGIARKDETALRKWFVEWADQQTLLTIQTRVLSLANTADIEEMLPYALAKVADEKAQPRLRGQAALTVGIHGTIKDLPVLEACFADNAVLFPAIANQKRGEVQLRDVMLAMALRIRNESLDNFGFATPPNTLVVTTSYYQLGFSSEEARESAFEKYRALK